MIKGKRREMFREIAYQEGPRAARRARAIITNPTHIAVALKYNPEEEPAPIILTMGVGVDGRPDHKNRSRKQYPDHAKCRFSKRAIQ